MRRWCIPSLPRVELHWRVHWYERQLRRRRPRAGRVKPAAASRSQMQPLDGLVALMLFYARDGFAGLRYPADAAAWWDLRCAGRMVRRASSSSPSATRRSPRRCALPQPSLGPGGGPAGAHAATCRSGGAWRRVWRARFSNGDVSRQRPTQGSTDLLLAPPSAAGRRDAARAAAMRPLDPVSPRRHAQTDMERRRSAICCASRAAGRSPFVPAVVRSYAPAPADRAVAAQPRRLERSAASRASHSPPTSAIHVTASDSGSGVTR